MVASAFQRRGPEPPPSLADALPMLGPIGLIVIPSVDEAALDAVCDHIRDRVAVAVRAGFDRAVKEMERELSPDAG